MKKLEYTFTRLSQIADKTLFFSRKLHFLTDMSLKDTRRIYYISFWGLLTEFCDLTETCKK